jgi:protein AaeX
MLSELHIGGVLLSPIVAYGLLAFVLLAMIRFVLGRTGLLRLAWHPALLEVSLYAVILSLLVLYF